MEIKTHNIKQLHTAEIITDQIIIQEMDDALELLGNIYYQGFDKLILHEKNITPRFFDLKTKLAGEILQKFTQYKLQLVIVGDFEKYKSNSLADFIYESNKGNQINFVKNIAEI